MNNFNFQKNLRFLPTTLSYELLLSQTKYSKTGGRKFCAKIPFDQIKFKPPQLTLSRVIDLSLLTALIISNVSTLFKVAQMAFTVWTTAWQCTLLQPI